MNCIVFIQKYIFVRRLIGRKKNTVFRIFKFLKFSVEELCDGRRCDGAG